MDVNQLENKEDSRKKGGGRRPGSKFFVGLRLNRCTGLFTILFSSTRFLFDRVLCIYIYVESRFIIDSGSIR